MAKNILFTCLILWSFVTAAAAQDDSTHFDLGRISVRKDFTQTVTISGDDLQRYPSSDLSDAINTWLSGTYSKTSDLVYVIEGNIINDVNAYSIYDIDKVTFVQSALAQANGAGPGQQLILITLKKSRPGNAGIEAAGQTEWVSLDNHNGTLQGKATTNQYHNYHLSGYKNTNSGYFGLSVDYQRDVLPTEYLPDFAGTPYHFNRLKLNGYASKKLWKGSNLTAGLNYVPQSGNVSFVSDMSLPSGYFKQNYYSENLQHLFDINISLQSVIAKGLTNVLSISYNHYNLFENDSLSTNNNGQAVFKHSKEMQAMHNVLVRDNLIYNFAVGAIDFEPAINFQYRNIGFNTSQSTSTLLQPSSTNSPPTAQLFFNGDQLSNKLYFLNPSMAIYYRNEVSLQGGFTALVNKIPYVAPFYRLHRILPFVAASANISSLIGIKRFSLNLFGSFSQRDVFLDDPYASLTGIFTVQNINVNGSGIPTFENSQPALFTGNDINYFEQYNSYEVGAVLMPIKHFTINYTISANYSNDYAQVLTDYSSAGFQVSNWYYFDKIITNRLGLNYFIVSNGFNWTTGLNVTQEKLHVLNNSWLKSQYQKYLNSGHRYSGGFTNRLSYKAIFAGIDVLYQLGERPLTLANVSPQNPVPPPGVYSFSLQNLYLGTRLKIKKLRHAELYVNSRNIWESRKADITDSRRMYGIGFKADL